MVGGTGKTVPPKPRNGGEMLTRFAANPRLSSFVARASSAMGGRATQVNSMLPLPKPNKLSCTGEFFGATERNFSPESKVTFQTVQLRLAWASRLQVAHFLTSSPPLVKDWTNLAPIVSQAANSWIPQGSDPVWLDAPRCG